MGPRDNTRTILLDVIADVFPLAVVVSVIVALFLFGRS